MVVAAAIREEIAIPEGVEVIINDNEVSVKGPNGEDSRKFTYPNVSIKEEDDVVILETAFPKKKDKAMKFKRRSKKARTTKVLKHS